MNQKVIEILEHALEMDHLINMEHYVKEALTELQKPDESEARIRVKDEAMQKVINWFFDDPLNSLPEERMALREELKEARKA